MADHSLLRVALAAAALTALGPGPRPVEAQAAREAWSLSSEQAEAYQMGLNLAASCSPRRHNSVPDSESVIEREAGPLVGTAAYYRSFEGTFVVLEEYDEDLEGHCLVFAWFGGALTPGSYGVRPLSMGTVEAEVDEGDHGFYATSAVRAADESSTFLTTSGTLDIATMDSGRVVGTFTLSGLHLEGTTRTDDVTLSGSFSALQVD